MDNQQLLADLIKHPEKVQPAHASILREMILQYPHVQPIYALLARAEQASIAKAALYINPTALFNLIQIKYEPVFEETFEQPEAEEDVIEDEGIFEEIAEVENIPIVERPKVFEVETPANLPGIDHHLMDLPADDNTISKGLEAEEFISFEQRDINSVPDAPEIETVIPDEPEINFVSKYDDDQLPYTFLWWLAKTRKEHEQIFQPYAQPKPSKVNQQKGESNKEFQQQYVEHIFHIQTPFEVADHLAEYPSTEIKDAKGAEIIAKFLKEDPIIKPPKPEQIDNENKAKKSAEDHYDLVSETLAKIYIEQMLYHKAIDTYKKLSLKYPEKSRYFADLIQSIEKKL